MLTCLNSIKFKVHILDVHEDKIAAEKSYTLSTREYCVILNPVDPKSDLN